MERETPTLQINTSLVDNQQVDQQGDQQEQAPTTPRDQPIRERTVEEWGQILKDSRRKGNSGNM